MTHPSDPAAASSGPPPGYRPPPAQAGQPPYPAPPQFTPQQPPQQPPLGPAPQQYAPPQPPPGGVVEIKYHQPLAAAIGIGSLVLAVAILWWLWYEGNLWDFTDGSGRATRGTIFEHLMPVALVVVAVVFLLRLLQKDPKIVFEGPGVRIKSKTNAAADGYRWLRWQDVSRVFVNEVRKGRSKAKYWVVLDRQGVVVANVPTSGCTPSPAQGLGQIAAVAAGRTQVG